MKIEKEIVYSPTKEALREGFNSSDFDRKTGYFFTPEQINEYTQNVIKQTLEIAAENVDADFEPMGWLEEQHLISPFIPGEDYEIGISRSSIESMFDQIFKKFEV